MTESGFVDFNHGRIYYEADGEGPALTLIHAGVANLRQWDEQVPAFAERFRVIRYDTRTFGRTTSENVEISNRADLAAVLDHLGVTQTAVLGLSRGGSIAVDFTLDYPDRVTALIAVSAGLGGFQSPPTPADTKAATGTGSSTPRQPSGSTARVSRRIASPPRSATASTTGSRRGTAITPRRSRPPNRSSRPPPTGLLRSGCPRW